MENQLEIKKAKSKQNRCFNVMRDVVSTLIQCQFAVWVAS